MKKWILIIVVILVFAGLAIFFYLNTSKGKKMMYAKIIAGKTGVDWKLYAKMDEGYLKGRADAIKTGSLNFNFNGATYNTESGRKI